MSWRAWFEQDLLPFFYLSRQERNGSLVLLVILNLTWILPVFLSKDRETIRSEEARALDSAFQILAHAPGPDQVHAARPQTGERKSARSFEREKRTSRFGPVLLKTPFDPNQADETAWIASGLPGWMIRNIRRYQEKGGRFRRPDDLLRIYGMDTGHFRKILPYLRIREADQPMSRTQHNGIAYPTNRPAPRAASININQADSSAWESLAGIGPVLASRIVRFREKLGGFVSIDQVGEVYGLPDSTFRVIRTRLRIAPGPEIVPLRINEAAVDELAGHPYLNRKISGLLVAYRKQHGPFRQPGDLLAIPMIDSVLVKRIAPYLSFN